MDIIAILIAAVLTEAVWETFKPVWEKGKINLDRIGSLAVGVIVAVVAKADICSALGLDMAYPVVGYIVTGMLISRGANFVHDLLKGVEQISAK